MEQFFRNSGFFLTSPSTFSVSKFLEFDIRIKNKGFISHIRDGIESETGCWNSELEFVKEKIFKYESAQIIDNFVKQHPIFSTNQRPILSTFSALLSTVFSMLEAVRVITCFQDIAVMRNTIQ